jgi:hypothetical protein
MQQGAFYASEGVNYTNPVEYQRGVNEIDEAVGSVQSAVSEANVSVRSCWRVRHRRSAGDARRARPGRTTRPT